MAFNTKNSRKLKPSSGPMASSPVPTGTLGGPGDKVPGYAYEDKSALFMLAVNSFFGQKKFYETAKAADDRFVALVRKVTKADPAWMLDFLTWLRASGNMRSSAVVGSVEAAIVARNVKGDRVWTHVKDTPEAEGIARKLAKAGIGRADEIGEAVAYFQAKYPGKQIPKPVKRGLADAMVEHFNEYTAAKYGSANSTKEFTPDRLINLLHPKPQLPWQADLFGYLVARRYGEVKIPDSLGKLRYRQAFMSIPVERRREFINGAHPQSLRDAGMTWEALAGWLQGPMDKAAWEAIIPNMGYMALLRNLRNFDEAGVSHQVANQVAAKLMDPEQVKRSKQFPFRFLAAFRAAPSLRWGGALSQALDCSLANIPALPGRTLVMVDTSGSMRSTFSEHSEMRRWDAAALFGIALGLRSPGVDVVSFSNHGKAFGVRKGADVLGELTRWGREGYNMGEGTNTFGVLQGAYRGHDRVIIVTDEQVNMGSPSAWGYRFGHQLTLNQIVPADRHVFVFNLAGYAQGMMPTDRFRHSFGGLTDACFPMIDMIERTQAGRWPWETSD